MQVGLRRIADLVIFVGPSGCGKSTIINRVVQQHPTRLGFSVSHTTRSPRDGEKDGVNYHFVNEEEFKRLNEQQEFLENAMVHSNYYGTSRHAVKSVLIQNKAVVMDTDILGAMNLRKHTSFSSIVVFVLPPSLEELERRLRHRQTESEEAIQQRLTDSRRWMEWYEQNRSWFDCALVNGNFEECIAEFERVVLPKVFTQPLSSL